MRLKTLRKERPTFEIEGAVINGNRIDISKTDLKSTKYRSNTAFAFPTSLNPQSSDQTHEMSTRSRQPIVIPTVSQSSSRPSYQAIEDAYLEHGIRIRLSSARTDQQSERKSVNNLQRHTVFVNRHPSRTSSVLHYTTTTNLDQHYDTRSFSALQQLSSSDFEPAQKHNVSYEQSLQIKEEIHNDYLSTSIIASETSNPTILSEKIPVINDITPTTTLDDTDPDLMYMSSLLKKPSGDCFLDTIRRRAGLRGTFATHRHSATPNSIQSQQQQSREKSPNMTRNSSSRLTTLTVFPSASSSNKINQDIIKHASRIRSRSQSKDYITKSPRIDTTLPISSPPTINNQKNNSINKSSKSMSLEPLEFLLSSSARSTSLSTHDLPLVKTSSKSRHRETSVTRPKSAKIPIIENQNTVNSLSTEHSISSSILSHDENLSLMKTSPLSMARQTNSFDSGYYDRSSSGGDVQSIISSSIIQISSSRPSVRLTNSAAHRSTTNKKVSFYEEPSTVLLTTTTTYV